MTTGIFHNGLLAVATLLHSLITVIMREFLEESAAVTIYHVIFFIDGNLLLAKSGVIGCFDHTTNQALLIVIL